MEDATSHHHHPAYPAAPDVVAEMGTDCDFAWAYLRADSRDGCATYFTSSTAFCACPKDWTLAPNQAMTLTYVPFEQYIPANSTILSAKLCVIAKNSWYMGARDSLIVTSLCDDSIQDWWTSKGVGANPNQAHASWNHPVQGLDDCTDISLLQSRGYPECSSGTWQWNNLDFHLWDLGRSQLSRFRGDECDGNGYCDEDCGWAAFQNGHDIEIEMRRLVQAIVNGEENRGQVLLNLDEGTSPLSYYYHWDTSGEGGNLGGAPTDYAPFWVITYTDTPYSSYLPDNHEGAMVFTTDDGIRNANLAYVQAYDDAGLPPLFGLYLAEVHVADNENRFTFADLADLRCQGVEIGSHSRWHAGDPDQPRDGLTVYDPNDYGIVSEYWRGMPASELSLNATGWDSLLVDTDPIWLYEGLEQATGHSYVDDPYVGKGLAFPCQQFDMPVIRALLYHDYKYFRCGIANTFYSNSEEQAYLRRFTLPWMEKMYSPADSVRVYCPTNNEPFNAMGLPLTLELVTLEERVNHDESSVKEWARHRMEVLMAQDLAGGILSIYSHDMPDGGTGWYIANLDPQWLTWILEEYLSMENVWICRPRDLNDWIRNTTVPLNTPSEWLVNDSWRWTAEDQVLVAGGGVPTLVGIEPAEPPYDSATLPASHCLGRNYPNPFNPRTSVTVDLPCPGHARLSILDIRGRCIRVLRDGFMCAGRHHVTWDGTDNNGVPQPSGTYLLRMWSSAGEDMEKMVLVR